MDAVVLVHGLGRTTRSMAALGAALSLLGYRVVNWRYPSLTLSVESHAAALRERVEALEATDVERVHFVTHSLGGIVTRAALAGISAKKIGRLVMLAPPNRGSRAARWLGRISSWPRSLVQLSDAPDSFVNSLPAPRIEIGVIAGRHDGKVPVEMTHLEGQTDHLVVPAYHTWLMWRGDVQLQIAAFLRHGRFVR